MNKLNTKWYADRSAQNQEMAELQIKVPWAELPCRLVCRMGFGWSAMALVRKCQEYDSDSSVWIFLTMMKNIIPNESELLNGWEMWGRWIKCFMQSLGRLFPNCLADWWASWKSGIGTFPGSMLISAKMQCLSPKVFSCCFDLNSLPNPMLLVAFRYSLGLGH